MNRDSLGRSLRWLCVAAFSAALAGPSLTSAQALSPVLGVDAVDSQSFPTVSLIVSAVDAEGRPLEGLTGTDFHLIEDGLAVDSIQVEPTTVSGLRLALTLDVSTDEQALAALKTALHPFLETLADDDQVALVAFADTPLVLTNFTADHTAVAGAIERLEVTGKYTALYQAISHTVELASRQGGARRLVIVITDSADNTTTPLSEAAGAAQAANVPLYLLGFGHKVKAKSLNTLAAQTRGQAFILQTPEEVTGVLESLQPRLRHAYRLTYRSRLRADDKIHRLVVGLNSAAGSAQVETTFKARTRPITISGLPITPGQTVQGTVTLAAHVEAPAPVTMVEYLLDGQYLLGRATQAPFNLTWDTASVPAGAHALSVKAVDAAGNSGQTVVEFNVAESGPLAVTASMERSPIYVGDDARVEAQIADARVPIAKVEFYLGDTLLGEDTAYPYSFGFSTRAYKPGTYTFLVRALDQNGRAGEARTQLEIAVPFSVAAMDFLSGLLPVFIVLLIVGVLLLAVLLWGWAVRKRRRLWQRTGMVELHNQGNVGAHFELLADDPMDAFQFQFRLNGAPLSFRTETVTRTAAPAPSASPQTAIAAPAARDNGAAGGGFREQAREVLAGLVEAGGEVLPGRLGASLHSLGWRLRQGERAVDRLERAMRPKKGGPFSAQAASSGATTAIATAAPETQIVQTLWAQTPLVEPGERLSVQLLITPRHAPRQQEYTFRVQARLANVPESSPLQEPGRVVYRPLPWYRQYLEWIVVAMATGIILALVRVLLGLLGVL